MSKKLKKKCDWVLLDVPCSGSGVLRRNPDLKWKYDPKRLQELLKVQADILEDSLRYLRNDRSKIVYSTCSIFREENLLQVLQFCDKHGLVVENQQHFETLPKPRGMDGFFSATLVPR